MTLRRLSVVLGCSAYTAMLIFTYAQVSLRLYGPAFPFKTDPLDFFVFGIGLAILPGLWLPIELKRPSQVAYWFLYLMAINPTMWLPIQVIRQSPENAWPFSLCILVAFALLALPYSRPVPVLPRIQVEPIFYNGAVLAVTLGLVGLVISITGLSFSISLADVYDRRAAAREAAPKGGGLAYFSGTLGSCMAPISFALGTVNRSFWLTGAGLLGLLTIFSFSGQKSVLFTPFLMLLVLWLVRKKGKDFGPWLVWLATGLTVICYVEPLIFGSMIVTSAFTHRLVFTPGMLHNFYWDFFTRNDHIYLADSVFSPFLVSPYDRNVGPLMGKELYQSDWMNATTGIWGHGYAHFGYLGVIFASVFALLIFTLIDSSTRQRNLTVGAMIMALFGIFWANAALHTSLISNGIILTVLLAYLMPLSRQKADQ